MRAMINQLSAVCVFPQSFLTVLRAALLNRASFTAVFLELAAVGAPSIPTFVSPPKPKIFTVTDETLELRLPSRIESIAEATAAAVKFARALGFDEDAAGAIDLAVRETVTNAVIHGNKTNEAIPFDLKIVSSSAALEITIRDRGAGFNPEDVPDPTDRENLLKPSGRGLLFMRAFMDEVSFAPHAEGGTVVRLVKKR